MITTALKRKILIVDDEPIVSDAARLMLEHLGHEVRTALSGKEALQLFQQEGNFDIVFTDYFMSEMKGDELAETIRTIRPGQPIAMITAYAEVLPPQHHVDMIISKPFLLRQLSEAIDRLAPAKG